jgi:amidase
MQLREMSSELWRHSASEVARLVRTRKAPAREVGDAALQRFDFVNLQINAIVDCRPPRRQFSNGVEQ